MYINRKTGELVEAEWNDGKDDPQYPIGAGWDVISTEKIKRHLHKDDFQAQYGEAMICPNNKSCPYKNSCRFSEAHIKDDSCDSIEDKSVGVITCPDCIPYIPEEYDVDNEPTFPICGTCMYEEEQTSQIIARATKEVEELISIGEKMTEQKEQKPVFVENMPTVNTPPLSTQSNSQEKPDSLLLSDEEIRNIFDRAIDVLIDSGIVLDDIMPEIKDCIKAELKHLEKLGIVYVSRVCTNCNDSGCACDKCWDGVQFIPFSEYRKENEK